MFKAPLLRRADGEIKTGGARLLPWQHGHPDFLQKRPSLLMVNRRCLVLDGEEQLYPMVVTEHLLEEV